MKPAIASMTGSSVSGAFRNPPRLRNADHCAPFPGCSANAAVSAVGWAVGMAVPRRENVSRTAAASVSVESP